MYGRFWKNIIVTPFFLITAIVCAILIVGKQPIEIAKNYAIMGIKDSEIYLESILEDELYNNMLYVILPVVLGIPYITFLYSEVAEKRYRDSLLRTGKDRYVSKHIFQAALSGIILSALVIILSISFSTAVIMGKGIAISVISEGWVKNSYLFYSELAEKGIIWGFFAAKLFMFLCYGAIWPVIAVVAIFFTENRYVATAIPFMVSALLEAAAGRFSFEWIRLSNLLASNWLLKKAYGGIPYTIFLLMFLCGICWILVRIRLDKLDMGTSI